MQAEPQPGAPLAYVSLGSEYDGAFAAYCRVAARHLFDVTTSPLSDAEIGAMPCAFGTALNLLTRAGVSEGQDVLITEGRTGPCGTSFCCHACAGKVHVRLPGAWT